LTTARCYDHALDESLRDEEQRPVQFVVRVVERLVVLHEGLRNEEACRVDQQRGVGVLGGELLTHELDTFSEIRCIRGTAAHAERR
jgi:hypothetical protein